MDAITLLDYLHEHAATAQLSEALAEILYARRTRATLRTIPVEVESQRRIRAAG